MEELMVEGCSELEPSLNISPFHQGVISSLMWKASKSFLPSDALEERGRKSSSVGRGGKWRKRGDLLDSCYEELVLRSFQLCSMWLDSIIGSAVPYFFIDSLTIDVKTCQKVSFVLKFLLSVFERLLLISKTEVF